jgi:hypothetical protein
MRGRSHNDLADQRAPGRVLADVEPDVGTQAHRPGSKARRGVRHETGGTGVHANPPLQLLCERRDAQCFRSRPVPYDLTRFDRRSPPLGSGKRLRWSASAPGATFGEDAHSGLRNPAHRAPVLFGDAIERLQGVVGHGDGATFHARSVAKSRSVPRFHPPLAGAVERRRSRGRPNFENSRHGKPVAPVTRQMWGSRSHRPSFRPLLWRGRDADRLPRCPEAAISDPLQRI